MLLLYLGIGAVAFVFRPRAFRWPDPGAITLGGAWWVLLVLYLTFSWTASGRTIGAQVMGLRVTDRSGERLHGPRAFLRAVICAAFPVGLVWCAIDRRRVWQPPMGREGLPWPHRTRFLRGFIAQGQDKI